MSVAVNLKCHLYVQESVGQETGTHRRHLTAKLWIEGHEETKLCLGGVLIAEPGQAMVVEGLNQNEVIGSEPIARVALLALHDVICADDLNRVLFRTVDLEPDINESDALLKIALELAQGY